MRRALRKAAEGVRQGGSPFGACIVRGGRLVACEHNRVLQGLDSTAHAEIVAIRAACRALATIDLSGCTIYSTTEPCPMCFSAIHWAKLDRIVFGARIADAQRHGFSELTVSNRRMKSLGGSPVRVRGGVLRAEVLRLFARWAAQPDKRTY
jgi:tRNA(Arg) A34 adenosine deaminase TadA